VIDSRPDAKKYVELAEPWQWMLMDMVTPAIESVSGIPAARNYKGPRNFWLTLPRGHDKTSSIGRLMSWLLAFSPRTISAVCAAADRDQASILAEFMQKEAQLNPWLYKRLSFQNYVVKSTWRALHTNTLKVLAADAFGTFGLTNEVVVCDELTHWGSRDLWDVLQSGRNKRPDSIFIVITNAGIIGSWQWEALQAVKQLEKTTGSWKTYEAPGPLASWQSGKNLEEQKAILPPMLARRVLLNEWIDPSEDCGFVTRLQAQKCENIGRELALKKNDKGSEGVRYYAGIDYGPVKDRTVCTVIHQREDGLIVVDKMDVWQGSRQSRVKIEAVEEWIEDVRKSFPNTLFVIDPYQMEGTIQKYEGLCRIERFEARGGKSNYEMAQALRQTIINEKIAWYSGAGDLTSMVNGNLKIHTLVDEFAELITKVVGFGYRMDHLPSGHDDRCVSLGMAVHRLLNTKVLRKLEIHEAYF